VKGVDGWVLSSRVGEGWARVGLITSFNMNISHVKQFTSKIKTIYDGFRIAGIFRGGL
jgi:hypothetical protein